MILDTLSQSASYQQLKPRFAAGLEWLGKFSAATADGRYDIDGDDVFALVQSYDTVPPTEKNTNRTAFTPTFNISLKVRN